MIMKTPETPISKSLVLDDFIFAVMDKPVQLVDIRTSFEYTQGHLKNAIHIDFFELVEFNTSFENLDKDRAVFLYCQTGHCSGTAKNELLEKGFSEVYDLVGGIKALKEQ